MVKISLDHLDSISLYRSNSKSLTETSESIAKMIDLSKATLITGDFNVCLMKNPTNIITTSLQKLGFKQLICEATHNLGNFFIYYVRILFVKYLLGGHIDHAYWRDPSNLMMDPILELYSPYYSDHDSILITIDARHQKPEDHRIKK